MDKVEKYIKDGKVALLISPGFGAGWSTWCGKELAYDKRVVEFFLEHKDNKEFMSSVHDQDSDAIKEARKLFKSWGYDYVYFGGFAGIKIKWVPIGTEYRITEYDGSESLETVNNIPWECA